ncbi:MAG: pyridoxamine 5-phosphate oxidase-related FMN-binding protein [Pedosphaera sp.]|nr:pyridoxamine 5-phosphate oxidase-related FMN-binding protein [Pedosphaera sp.]
MSDAFFQIAFTPAVIRAQEHYNGHASVPPTNVPPVHLSEEEIAFIKDRDSFYVATVSETGWPYIQHRGGPRGFLRVIDDQTLAFVDFHGNRQLITAGNLAANARVALFLMDYNQRERLKILGHAKVVDARTDETLARSLAMPGYSAKIERVFIIHVAATDWNCPQHITPRE